MGIITKYRQEEVERKEDGSKRKKMGSKERGADGQKRKESTYEEMRRKGRRGEARLGQARTEGWAKDNRRKEEEQRGKENKGQGRGRQSMRGEKRRRKEYATHVSSQRALPASQLPVLAARILTDRPYGFIMRHTHTNTDPHTPCMRAHQPRRTHNHT